MTRLLIVDGTNTFIRNYVMVPYLNSNGDSSGGVFGFLKSLRFVVERCSPDRVIVVFDGAGGSLQRRSLWKEYKSNRKPIRLNRTYEYEQDNPEENMKYQIKRLYEYLDDLPVVKIVLDNIEADDVIAHLVGHYRDEQKVIVSTDMDFYQLLDENTVVYSPTKKIFITNKNVKEMFSMTPNNLLTAKSFIGDKGDNVKGIGGVGFKNILKYFPFLSEERNVAIDEIFQYSEQKVKNGEQKYKKFVDDKEKIMLIYKVIQLKEPMIKLHNIDTIKVLMENKTNFNISSFKLRSMEDGFIDDKVIDTFRLVM